MVNEGTVNISSSSMSVGFISLDGGSIDFSGIVLSKVSWANFDSSLQKITPNQLTSRLTYIEVHRE